MEEDISHEPIELFSADLNDYRTDVLRKIIPLITSPCGKRWLDNVGKQMDGSTVLVLTHSLNSCSKYSKQKILESKQ